MRIGICGAQSVGKTTLLNALRSEKWFKEYTICNEVTRRVRDYGLRINENGDNVTQQLIMQEHIVNVFMYDNMITDRTALDGVVYTKYLVDKKKVSTDTLTFAYKVFNKVMPKYDLLFYIPPEFEIADDGERSTDVEFRNSIVKIFNEHLEKINCTLLRGSVRERVETVVKAYKALENVKEMVWEREMDDGC